MSRADNIDMMIEVAADGLPPGQTARMDCPACSGGNNLDRNTFSLTRDGVTGNLMGKCWRASCPFTYFRAPGATTPYTPPPGTSSYSNANWDPPKRKTPHWVHEKEKHGLLSSHYRYLCQKYHIREATAMVNHYQYVKPNILVMPAYDWHYEHIGYYYKGVAGNRLKLSEKFDSAPVLYARSVLSVPEKCPHAVVLTEGKLDADRVAAEGYNAIALGSTHLKDELVQTLLKDRTLQLIVPMLDPDVWGKAPVRAITDKFSGTRLRCWWVPMSRLAYDPKDTPLAVLAEILDSINRAPACL